MASRNPAIARGRHRELTTRVLPTTQLVIPAKTQLGKLEANLTSRLDLKGNGDITALRPSQWKDLGQKPLEKIEHGRRRKLLTPTTQIEIQTSVWATSA